jgi:hypothetical protein
MPASRQSELFRQESLNTLTRRLGKIATQLSGLAHFTNVLAFLATLEGNLVNRSPMTENPGVNQPNWLQGIVLYQQVNPAMQWEVLDAVESMVDVLDE